MMYAFRILPREDLDLELKIIEAFRKYSRTAEKVLDKFGDTRQIIHDDWLSLEIELCEISQQFPDVVLCLDYDADEFQRAGTVYAKNGTYYHAGAFFPAFNEALLKKPEYLGVSR